MIYVKIKLDLRKVIWKIWQTIRSIVKGKKDIKLNSGTQILEESVHRMS